jgi:hypothetical protein
MPNPTPSSIRANQEADEIVRRILKTNDTLVGIAEEYGVAKQTIELIYRRRTTEAQRRQARRRKLRRYDHWWTRGKPSWNKGRKGIHLNPAGEFKPGQRPVNGPRRYREVGTLVVRKGRVFIKVADAGPHGKRWDIYSRVVWRKNFGEIPAGKRIVFKDGDKLNCAPENLECISGGDTLYLAVMKDPSIEDRRLENATKGRRRRAVYERAMAAHRASVERAA